MKQWSNVTMKYFFQKTINRKYLPYTIGFFVFVLGFVVIITPAKAADGFLDGIGSALVSLLSWLFMAFVNVVGTLLLKAIDILIKIAGYGDFLTNPIVDKGWVVVRDVANIVLVLALLYMAFATVFRRSSYQYQNLLPKIVLAAILINFSKTITGLIIDLGQVFMMTFVYAFREVAAGNLTYGFGLHDLLAFRDTASQAGIADSINNWSIFGSLVLASLMVLVAFLVVISLVLMLLFRILALWFLVIFSPIAFLGGILPSWGTVGGLTSRWWSELWRWVFVGPVIAFCLWLSIAVISEMTTEKRIINLSLQSANSQGTVGTDWQAFASKVSGTQNMVDYLVTTGLMIMCLVLASKIGTFGAGFASTSLNKLKGYGNTALSTVKKGAWGVARTPGRMAAAGVRATKLPYIAGAGLERFKTSGVGQKIGLDKEYKGQKEAERKAWAEERVGGKAGAIGAFRFQEAQKELKSMKEKGMLEGGEDAQRKLLRDLLSRGKLTEAKAVMMNMAQAKDANLKSEDVELFENKAKARPGSKEEQELLKFEESLMNMQKASGDTMAKYKFNIERDSQGNLGRVIDKVKQVGDDFEKKKEADFNDAGIFKAFDENKAEFREILNKLADKKNMQALGSEGRAGYAKILQKMLARHFDADDDFNLEELEGAGSTDKYAKLLQKMHAKKFVAGSGEVIIDTASAERTGDQKHVIRGNEEFKKATGFDINAEQGTFNMSTGRDESVLSKVAEKNKNKKFEKERENIIHGREILSVQDKEINERVLAPLMMRKKIQPNLYNLQSAAYNEDNEGIITAYHDLQGLISNKVSQYETDITNPQTGQKYTSGIEVYQNSKIGKLINEDLFHIYDPNFNIDNMSDNEKKKLKQQIDSVIYIAQRAEGGVAEGRTAAKAVVKKDMLAIPQSERIESRKINRQYLGNAVNLSDRLSKSDMTTGDRNKFIKDIIKNVKLAKNNSKKREADNKNLNQELKDLHQMAKGIKSDKTNLEDFNKKAQSLLDRVNIT